MNSYKLKLLKEEGHRLIEEYISLDRKRKGKRARTHAYAKLKVRLKGQQPNHFAQIWTEREAKRAVDILKSMISRRKKKNAGLDSGKLRYHRGKIYEKKPKKSPSVTLDYSESGVPGPEKTRITKIIDWFKRIWK